MYCTQNFPSHTQLIRRTPYNCLECLRNAPRIIVRKWAFRPYQLCNLGHQRYENCSCFSCMCARLYTDCLFLLRTQVIIFARILRSIQWEFEPSLTMINDDVSTCCIFFIEQSHSFRNRVNRSTYNFSLSEVSPDDINNERLSKICPDIIQFYVSSYCVSTKLKLSG